jgi:putative sterol carrier protein
MIGLQPREVFMPTSVKEFFDSKVGGTWTADLQSVPPTCVRGEAGAPQCTIEASDSDFRTMIDGGMPAAMQLFFSGKLKVTGDANLAPRLSKLLQMGAASGY